MPHYEIKCNIFQELNNGDMWYNNLGISKVYNFFVLSLSTLFLERCCLCVEVNCSHVSHKNTDSLESFKSGLK